MDLPETTEVVDPQNQIRMDLQHDRRQVRNGTQRHRPFTSQWSGIVGLKGLMVFFQLK